ncbi:MAG: serine hydrolase [Cyanobacteria bacterium P01_C01_bin.89]
MAPLFFRTDDTLNQLGQQLLEALWERYPTLARNQFALTWIVYDPSFPINTGGALTAADFWKHRPRGFSYRGFEQVYPASVVKLFYGVAIQEWLESGMVPASDELTRALRDALVDSSNDATSLLVDVLSGTSSGPELSPGPFEAWKHQRNIVNRYLKSFNWSEFETINVNQKTWGDGPYGREREFVGAAYNNRNMLTTEAIARMLHGIIGGVAVSAARSQELMAYLQRDLDPEAIAQLDPDYNQITGFLGESLPPTAKQWSKAGWMSRVRLDAAYIELPTGFPYLVSVVIDSPLGDRDQSILPFVSSYLQEAVLKISREENETKS